MTKPIPWITPLSSPLEFHNEFQNSLDVEKAEAVQSVAAASQNEVPSTGNAAAAKENGHHSEPTVPRRREASAIELFYDLFFVANLATVTITNEIVDARTLKAYLGFFTLLWFTWLQTVLFDVRFASESLFHHIHKAVSFAVMMGMVIGAATYDTSDVHSTVNGFRAMSFVLMTSRLALGAQYAVTAWLYLRHQRSHKWRVPMIATTATLLCAGIGFLGVSFALMSSPQAYSGWYAICAIEAALVIAISCRWREIGFTRTHLVDRLGQLTLIILGEGIFGLSKTTYQLFQTVNRPDANDYGILICAVLLIYMLFMLYFGHVEHDKFGTVRQQLWTILHYPLHVALLLTVEGSSFLILAGVIGGITEAWGAMYPLATHPTWEAYFAVQKSPAGVVAVISGDLDSLLVLTFKDRAALKHFYNYTVDIQAIQNIPAPFNSSEWQYQASEAINSLFSGVEAAIYHSFGIEGKSPHDHQPSSIEEAAAARNMMTTVFLYFFFSAGSFLLAMAVMYYFAKKQHSPRYWISIASRVVVGVGVMLPVAANWVDNEASYGFYLSPWTIGVVMLGYLIVILLDHLVAWYGRRKQKPDPS